MPGSETAAAAAAAAGALALALGFAAGALYQRRRAAGVRGAGERLSERRLEEARRRVAAVTPYFAFKGIDRFYDIGGFLKHPAVFEEVITLFVDHLRDLDFDAICGLDARGFILGPPVALRLNKPFFMVRKQGKLPNSITGEKYGKEYESGQDRLCVPVDAIAPGQRVVVIDDLVATGGTALAALELVKRLGGVCTELACVIEIKALGARRLLEEKGFGETNILSIVEEDLLTLAGEPADPEASSQRV